VRVGNPVVSIEQGYRRSRADSHARWGWSEACTLCRMPDLYEVLQVHRRAEPEVIRAAYRTLARKYHPDHGGNARRMIELNDAWDVLGDPLRRAEYDATLAPLDRPAVRPTFSETYAHAAPQPAPAASADPTAPRAPDAIHAGPPPGRPSGTVLDFGRYAGWSLGEIARYDRVYLEWLTRATFGRKLRAEVDALLRATAAPPAAPQARDRR
jgi:curved DNA-binding protein CbpA